MAEQGNIHVSKPNKQVSQAKTQQKLGTWGEDLCCRHFEEQGYKVIARNWRAGRFAEVDIILWHPQGLYVFAEIKTRSFISSAGEQAMSGIDSVSRQKRQKIITAAKIFSARQNLVDYPVRFDVCIVESCRPPGESGSSGYVKSPILHIEDAF